VLHQPRRKSLISRERS